MVRAFRESDIPQVAALHRTVFRIAPRRDGEPERYDAYFRRVYLDHPGCHPDLPSLVYESNGRIAGFLGVVPRRMRMGGRPLQAAVSSQFVVESNGCSALVAVQLARTFLEGPQDVSIADEANDGAQKLWEGLGGATALLPSMHWIRPLRPARLALSFLRRRTGLGRLAPFAVPPSLIVDALATRTPGSRLFQTHPDTTDTALSADTVLAAHRECTAGSLRIEYDRPTLDWLIERAALRKPGCTFEAAAIGTNGQVAGWYMYALERGGTAEVLQLAARPGAVESVLDHLFYRAWCRGAAAVGGRLESRFLQVLSDKYCLFHRRGPWMLVHARRSDVVRAFQLGDVFFSRLDGEWCLRFSPAP
jgi:hypothetical protein